MITALQYIYINIYLYIFIYIYVYISILPICKLYKNRFDSLPLTHITLDHKKAFC